MFGTLSGIPIGEKIRRLREKNGVTRQKLAYALNISESTLWRWEKGITVPSLEELKKIADLFNVDLKYFFDADVPLIAANRINTKINILPEEAKEELEVFLDYLLSKYSKKK